MFYDPLFGEQLYYWRQLPSPGCLEIPTGPWGKYCIKSRGEDQAWCSPPSGPPSLRDSGLEGVGGPHNSKEGQSPSLLRSQLGPAPGKDISVGSSQLGPAQEPGLKL